MRKCLIVYLKDTHWNGDGAAQWVYAWPDADQLVVEVRGSGLLWVGRNDPELQPNERGQRAHTVATFPAGGWSGYAWEIVPDGRADAATGAVPESRIVLPS